jgi:hypothetical protein
LKLVEDGGEQSEAVVPQPHIEGGGAAEPFELVGVGVAKHVEFTFGFAKVLDVFEIPQGNFAVSICTLRGDGPGECRVGRRMGMAPPAATRDERSGGLDRGSFLEFPRSRQDTQADWPALHDELEYAQELALVVGVRCAGSFLLARADVGFGPRNVGYTYPGRGADSVVD